jgi:hypothetical protein
LDDAAEKAMRPGLVWDPTNDDGELKWPLVEITYHLTWIDHDGEILCVY